MDLVFATRNRHKFNEVKQMFKYPVRILSLDDIGHDEEIEEIGKTLRENALVKARAVYREFGCNVFADDSGLEVDALGGNPGVNSACFAGCDKDDVANMAKVLKLLEHHQNRAARFKTVIALITSGNNELLFEGVIEGSILDRPTGNQGFGYDPIFKPSGFDCSFAEMSTESKNRVSHRGKAIEKLIAYIYNLD